MLKTARKFDRLPVGDLALLITTRGSALGRKLAPDRDVLMKYKNGELSWEAFADLYLRKIQHMWDVRDEAIVTVARFVNIDKRTLWVTCWEKETDIHCHRHLLKSFLESHASEL